MTLKKFFLMAAVVATTGFFSKTMAGSESHGDDKLASAHAIARRIIRQADPSKVIDAASDKEVRDFISELFKKNQKEDLIKKLSSLKPKKTSQKMTVRMQDGKGNIVEHDVKTRLSPDRVTVEFDESVVNKESRLELGFVWLHEFFHSMDDHSGPDTFEHDRMIWEAVYAFADGIVPGTVTPNILPDIQTATAKLPEVSQTPRNLPTSTGLGADGLPVGLDPYVRNLLNPGNIAYSEIFKPYDDFKPARDASREAFLEVVKNLKPDENGVIRLPLLKTDEKYHWGIGYTIHNGIGTIDAYMKALQEAYSPITGLKVVGSGMSYVDFVSGYEAGGTDAAGDAMPAAPRTEGKKVYEAYIVVDLQAEEKIQIMKLQSFERIEMLASRIRRAVMIQWAEDLQYLDALKARFGQNPTVDSIQKDILGSDRITAVVSASLQRMNPEEIRHNLPVEAAARRQALTTMVESAQNSVMNAVNVCAEDPSDANKRNLEKQREWLNSVLLLLNEETGAGK
jgi:ribosomal protein L16/L10AE